MWFTVKWRFIQVIEEARMTVSWPNSMHLQAHSCMVSPVNFWYTLDLITAFSFWTISMAVTCSSISVTCKSNQCFQATNYNPKINPSFQLRNSFPNRERIILMFLMNVGRFFHLVFRGHFLEEFPMHRNSLNSRFFIY